MDGEGEAGIEAAYVLPLRALEGRGAEELASYVNALPFHQIIVVDGSPPGIFSLHHRLLHGRVQHVRPSPNVRGANGKARGVLCGLALARYERLIIADDDVRYDERSARAVVGALDVADVVRPQNYFRPLPWHALLDSARSLINRLLDGDWPGTLGVRKSALPHGYNANVLFENYELVRTVRERGGREHVARDIFVRRLAPSTQHFFSQRVRQAYDEFARPHRMIVSLAILPVSVVAVCAHAGIVIPILCAAAIVTAFGGWVRGGAYRYIPAPAVAAAPLWLLERSVCSWLALYERMRYGGIRYAGAVLRDAASSNQIRRAVWAA